MPFEKNELIDSSKNDTLFSTPSEQDNDYGDGANNLQNLTHSPDASRSGRPLRPTDRYTNTSAIIALNVRMGNQDCNAPTSNKESVSSPDDVAWRNAMEKEMSNIENNGTWSLEAPEKGLKGIGN